MSTQRTKDKSVIVWQEVKKESDGIPEPAILVSPYSDCITLHQGTSYINLNYGSLDELIKILRQMNKENR